MYVCVYSFVVVCTYIHAATGRNTEHMHYMLQPVTLSVAFTLHSYPSSNPPPKVLGQDDTFWWQACKYGSHSAAGLIPSQQLEERRRAYTLGENGAVGCLGRRKQKRQLLYSSHHNGCEWVWSLIMGRVASAE